MKIDFESTYQVARKFKVDQKFFYQRDVMKCDLNAAGQSE